MAIDGSDHVPDPRAPLPALRRYLATSPGGLSSREAARHLAVYGPNEVRRQEGPSLAREVVRQLTHPLALLLWGAAGLAYVAHTATLTGAIVAVIVLNGVFALVQERQAERAVEALGRYLPQRARVRRDGTE